MLTVICHHFNLNFQVPAPLRCTRRPLHSCSCYVPFYLLIVISSFIRSTAAHQAWYRDRGIYSWRYCLYYGTDSLYHEMLTRFTPVFCGLAANDITNIIQGHFTAIMTSSNGSIFRVTDPLWGELTSHRWIPPTKASDVELWCFLRSKAWTNGLVNNGDVGGLRRHYTHYDVTVIHLVNYAIIASESTATNMGKSIR